MLLNCKFCGGELEPIEAVYDNGYAVFTTNHFSIYTVTRLTPAERCAKYGHQAKTEHGKLIG